MHIIINTLELWTTMEIFISRKDIPRFYMPPK